MNYKNVNDYELIYRIRENDDEIAMNDLILKYEPVIAKIAQRYRLNDLYYGVDFNDFMQEGRIAVVKALKSYDLNGDSLFYTYVSICINRQFISYCRSLCASKNAILNLSASDDCLITVGDLDFEPVSYYGSKLVENKLREFIYSLKMIDSCIFELRYNGFSYKEISDLLDVSLPVVSRRLCKIKKSLQIMKDKF